MIPFIRTHSELMAITESRDSQIDISKNIEDVNSSMYRNKRKKNIISFDKKLVDLPNLPKNISHKLNKNKKSISKFIDELDYNNQIQSSYDLILLERQSKINKQDAA